jgi:DNA-binding NtrC family response regulator
MSRQMPSPPDRSSGDCQRHPTAWVDAAKDVPLRVFSKHLIGGKTSFGGTMPAAAGARKILIIDDEPTIADTLAMIFASSGYESRAVYSAEEALEMLEEWHPDLAIIDVVLPGMNGIDFAIFLKASYPQCQFLLFSGQPGTSSLLEEARKKGHLFEILAKPLHPTFMLATVSDMLTLCQDPPNPNRMH